MDIRETQRRALERKLRAAHTELYVALTQSIPSDDHIIMAHVREAARILANIIQEKIT